MTLEFERRHEEYLEKRKKKLEEKRIQEENEKRKRDEDERRKREKLLQSHPAEGSIRLTKAMEKRVNAVKVMTKKKEDEEMKERVLQMKQEKRLKETSEFLKSLIRKPVKSEEEVLAPCSLLLPTLQITDT